MKKVLIIGAGLAGLSAGIYARQSGFDVTIYESHTIPGGASTSWRRKGYYFEGGLHWLTGSSPKTPLNKLWREVGALDDSVSIYNRDPFFLYEENGVSAKLYRDPEQLRKHFLALSPEDSKATNRLYHDMKKFMRMQMPVMDLPKLKVKNPMKFPVSMMISMLPALPRMKYYQNLSATELGEQFRNPQIRNLLQNMLGGDFSATSVLFTIATLASGDGGYPTGGSLAMAGRMAKYFESLGGNIQYQTMVEKVSVENGIATGVVIDGNMVPADAVIVTQDTLSAIDQLFDEPIREPWAEQMRSKTEVLTDVFVGIGVEADLSDLPLNCTFPASKPIQLGEITYRYIGFNNYAGFRGYAPEGCTTLTSVLMGGYEFWKNARDNGTYAAEKQKLADALIDEIGLKYPQIVGKIAVVDVATPLTYERYLHSYHGSWMTLTKKGQPNRQYPCKPECMQNLYFAGQRLATPGGCPVALTTGRTAAQQLCLDTDTVFQGNL